MSVVQYYYTQEKEGVETLTIDEFLQLKEPEKYDFSDDCTTDNIYKSMTGLEKFFAYKTNPKAADPDNRSVLLQDIYSVVWKELLCSSNGFMFSDGKTIASDTMTSAWTPIKKYMLINFKDKLEALRKEKKYKYISAEVCKDLYLSDESVRRIMDNNSQLVRFASLYHSIGNYTPVPVGFNVPRSGFYASHDMWDLSLMKIREFYYEPQEIQVAQNLLRVLELLHYDKTTENVLSWLSYFGEGENGWKRFVETMLFLPHINMKTYEVIPLCPNHSWDNIEITDYDAFFERVSDSIVERGKSIIAKLRERN